jgi:hypothetical protein
MDIRLIVHVIDKRHVPVIHIDVHLGIHAGCPIRSAPKGGAVAALRLLDSMHDTRQPISSASHK